MFGIQPVIALTLGGIRLGERPNALITLVKPIVVSGLFLFIMPRKSITSWADVVQVKRIGYALALCGAATFNSRDVISRHVGSRISDPLVSVGLALVVGSVILIVGLHRHMMRSIQTGPPN